MKVRIELVLVAGMFILTVVAGLMQGILVGGLIGQDPVIWFGCRWIQGAVGGLVCCGSYGIAALLQGVTWLGLALKKNWGWAMGLLVAVLYTGSIFMPIGLWLFISLLAERKRAIYLAATS